MILNNKISKIEVCAQIKNQQKVIYFYSLENEKKED